MKSRLLSLVAVLAPLCLAGCGAADGESGAPQQQEDLRATSDLHLTAADDGVLASVVKGKSVVVELEANPSTGFHWEVALAEGDEAFATFEEEFTGDSDAVGSGGITKFTWGKAATARTGRHVVCLMYVRASDYEPNGTFCFTLDVTTKSKSKALQVTEEDNGVIALARSGQDLVLSLPANPSTGFEWFVVRTDKTFGYPKTKYKASGEAVGSGGTAVMTWKTVSPLEMNGDHKVSLAYQREGDEEPERTFDFTVRIAP